MLLILSAGEWLVPLLVKHSVCGFYVYLNPLTTAKLEPKIERMELRASTQALVYAVHTTRSLFTDLGH